MNLSYRNFPYRDAAGSGYRFEVTALAKSRSSKTASKTYEVSVRSGTALKITSSSASMKDKIVKKAKSCLKDGKAAVVGATVEAGTLAVMTSWIPGIDVVTATTAGVIIAAGTLGSYLGCAMS